MSHNVSPKNSTRRAVRFSAAVAIAASLALPAVSAAAGQDLRSPDARGTAVTAPSAVAQDLRSPDAREGTQISQPSATQDLRSPDARVSGNFVSAPQTQPTGGSGSFDWIYVAGAIVLSLLAMAGLLFTQRRRHGLAVGR